MVDTSGRITTFAGATHYAGDLGQATNALLHQPQHAIKDAEGNLYIADTYNHAIRKVDTSGKITTIAGNGACGYTGDRNPAVSATLCYPQALALDSNRNLYIADSGNYVVRRIDSGGQITTYAGNGTYGDAYHGSQRHGGAVPSIPSAWQSMARGIFMFPMRPATAYTKSLPMERSAWSRAWERRGTLGDGGLATAAQLEYPTPPGIGRIGQQALHCRCIEQRGPQGSGRDHHHGRGHPDLLRDRKRCHPHLYWGPGRNRPGFFRQPVHLAPGLLLRFSCEAIRQHRHQ